MVYKDLDNEFKKIAFEHSRILITELFDCLHKKHTKKIEETISIHQFIYQLNKPNTGLRKRMLQYPIKYTQNHELD
jgi:hypothetical protein